MRPLVDRGGLNAQTISDLLWGQELVHGYDSSLGLSR